MRLKNNKAADPDGLHPELFNFYLQNMARGKYFQRFEPQCPPYYPEKGRPYDMLQLQGYKPSPYRI